MIPTLHQCKKGILLKIWIWYFFFTTPLWLLVKKYWKSTFQNSTIKKLLQIQTSVRAFLINSSATSKFLRVGGSIVNKVMAGYDDRDLLVLIFSRGQKLFFWLKWRKEYMITIMQENSFSHNISVTKLQAKTKVYVSIKSLL